jgi:hypothetical protein
MKHANQSPRLTSTPSEPLARRLHGLARWVRGLTLLAAIMLACVPVLLLVSPEWLLAMGQAQPTGLGLLHLSEQGLTVAVKVRMAAVTLINVWPGLAALWQLWVLFGEYRRGAVFSPRALASLTRFGWLMLALAVAQVLSQALMSVAVSWDNAPGHRVLMVSLGSNDYALVLGALVFVAIGRVMTEAARVAEENEQFV